MGDASITRGEDLYTAGLGRRAVIIASAIMLNSLVLIIFMWSTTFRLLKVGDSAWLNVIASSVRSATLVFNAWRLRRFRKRGYSVKTIDEVARSFGILELINSAALLAFLIGTLSSLEDYGLSANLGWVFILFKSAVLAYFLRAFVVSVRQQSSSKNRESVRKQLRDLVILALIDSATIAAFMWLMWRSLNNSGDPRANGLMFFASVQTITLSAILGAYTLNRPKESESSS